MLKEREEKILPSLEEDGGRGGAQAAEDGGGGDDACVAWKPWYSVFFAF